MKYLILIAFSFGAYAESFKIGGTLIEFINKEGLITKGCVKSCDALKQIQKHKSIDILKVREGMKFTNSVGSDVCGRVYKAEALIGVTETGDQRAFCYFKDKSMVEMNSLSSYLIEKKIVKE